MILFLFIKYHTAFHNDCTNLTPTSKYKIFLLLTFSLGFIFQTFAILPNSYPNKCEVISHCDFDIFDNLDVCIYYCPFVCLFKNDFQIIYKYRLSWLLYFTAIELPDFLLCFGY